MQYLKTKIAASCILAVLLFVGALGPAWAPDAFSEGLELFNGGKWAQAADKFAAAASARPSDAVVRLTAGVALANAKRYTQAVEQFRAAAGLSPDGVLPHLLLDGTYSELGDAARAREARDQANRILGSGRAFGLPASSDSALISSLVKHPSNAIARCLLGDLYQLQGKLDAARDQYTRASRLAPKWAKPVFNLGLASLGKDAKAAEKSFDKAIELDPDNRRIFLWQGDAYLQQGRYVDALNAYRNAARDRQLESEANTRIGNAEMRAGNYAAATEQFRQAAKQAPQDPRPIAGEAQALQNIGKLKEAETKYSQAAQVLASNQAPPPAQAVVQQQMAVVQQQQGKVEEAIDTLSAGYALHPTLDSARALASAQHRAGKLAESISEHEAILKKDRDNRAALTYLLAAYKLSQNWTALISTANRLASLDPAGAVRYYQDIGGAYASLGGTSKAVEAYMRAMNSGNATTWDDTAQHALVFGALPALEESSAAAFKANSRRSTGLVLFELRSAKGDTAGMIEVADRLTKLYPDDPVLWLRLGQAYEQAGQKALALAAYAKAASGSNPEAVAAAKVRIEAVERGASAQPGSKGP